MKKHILLLLALAAAIVAGAQGRGNYYNWQKIYIDSTLTFKCSNSGSSVLLQNIHAPVFSYEERIPANIDSKLAESMIRQNCRFLSNQAFLDAFHETFTASELRKMADYSIGFVMAMNNQGNVVSLSLLFSNDDRYFFKISPQKYATLYKKLKAYVKVYVKYPQINYWGLDGTIMLEDVIVNRQLFGPERYAKE